MACYVEAARAMLDDGNIKHIVGCYTSSSRKEVLPTFEKHDALLWYPSHYEGFETSDNVIYTGAAPNQHVIPLTRYLLRNNRRSGFFVGSNYIWAWENNRIMREALHAAGGTVLGERYFAVGETDLSAVYRQILDSQPSFVFCTLIGESAYAFYRGFREAAEARRIDQPAEIPIVSCSLAEPELLRIGDAAAGHLSSSVYFSTVDTAENRRFVRAWRQRFVQDIARNVKRLNEETFVSVLLVEQSLDLIVSLAERGLVMDKGRIVAMLDPGGIKSRDAVRKYLAL